MSQYFDKITKGTEREDMLVILQFLKTAIGQRFSFLNYYKEIPISFYATLLSIENEMAEFELHEYQAKVISLKQKTLIHSHPKSPFCEDIVANVFNVNTEKKRAIIYKFGYAKIHSELRRFVRVTLDKSAIIQMFFENKIKLSGQIMDISLGGAAISIKADELLAAGADVDILLTLPETNNKFTEISLGAKIIKIIADESKKDDSEICMLEFYFDKNAQQQISFYINQRQVSIIKELKDLLM